MKTQQQQTKNNNNNNKQNNIKNRNTSNKQTNTTNKLTNTIILKQTQRHNPIIRKVSNNYCQNLIVENKEY